MGPQFWVFVCLYTHCYVCRSTRSPVPCVYLWGPSSGYLYASIHIAMYVDLLGPQFPVCICGSPVLGICMPLYTLYRLLGPHFSDESMILLILHLLLIPIIASSRRTCNSQNCKNFNPGMSASGRPQLLVARHGPHLGPYTGMCVCVCVWVCVWFARSYRNGPEPWSESGLAHVTRHRHRPPPFLSSGLENDK